MIDYAEYSRKTLPSSRVKFKPSEGKCPKGYRQITDESRTYQEINCNNMAEQLQMDYPDKKEL